jgi:hypothetical protein
MGREFGNTTRQKETAIIPESMKQVNKEHRNCADQREGKSLTISACSPYSSMEPYLSTRSICAKKSIGERVRKDEPDGAAAGT